MMSLQSFPIVGLTEGLQTNVKPAMLPDQAWALLQNAYTFRERELKREGRKFLGRLTRILTAQSLGTTPAGPPATVTITDIFATLGLRTTNPQAEFTRGTLVITVGAPDSATFTDNGNGTFTVTGAGVAAGSYINYVTGKAVLQFTALTGGATITAAFSYYPTLPVMGIPQRLIPAINDEQTIWFDTVYAYVWNGSGFQEFIPGTTWAGADFNLFWAFNYRGATPQQRLFFVTNDVPDAADPIRYTDGITWTNFAPLVTATQTLYQCLIIIAYYGRLLFLNTWEGTTAGGVGAATNFFNRCRFSAQGDPTIVATSWRTDIFGKGGLLDAPTNEAIIGATFIGNSLVVDFEQSTWQLRYVGEYGQPFLWERVSADFGSESTFSGVLFDNNRLAVGDKAITNANSLGVNRIDLKIPDQIFDFKNANNGVQRVSGIRDYQRELVFWNFADANTQAADATDVIFPNKVLVYNYRNSTWALFNDSITRFGTFQSTSNITWDSLTTYWDSETTTWDNPSDQSLFPIIVTGNQQGFISCYGYDAPSSLAIPSVVNANDQETLTIQSITTNSGYVVIGSVNHNLQPDDIIYITSMQFIDSGTFLPVATSLNNMIFKVSMQSFNTKDDFSLLFWNKGLQDYQKDFTFTPDLATSIYVGGGNISVFPKLNILSKDINIFQGKSLQTKLSRLDFLFQSVPNGAVTIKLFLNSSTDGSVPGVVGQNNLVWNGNLTIDAKPPFYTTGSDYAWFRFYATLAAQYFNINITYDDNLMNTLATHSQDCTLYAINAWCRPGGKNVF